MSYSAQQCLDMAKECGRMASQAKDRDARAALIEFARQWLELARHKEHERKILGRQNPNRCKIPAIS